MFKHNQDGAMNSLLIIIILAVLLIAAIIFGGASFSSEHKYKDDDSTLISAAVSTAVTKEIAVKNAQFAAANRYPLDTYNGPEEFGSMIVKYPRTWSGYIDNDGSSGSSGTLSVYFNPGLVPSVSAQGSVFALTVQVLNQSYSQTLGNYEQQNGPSIKAYSLPALPKVVGVEISGSISQNQTYETMVILPLRGNTLEIATDGTQYLNDFNSIILPNFTFSP
jgi:hypothetical protein